MTGSIIGNPAGIWTDGTMTDRHRLRQLPLRVRPHRMPLLHSLQKMSLLPTDPSALCTFLRNIPDGKQILCRLCFLRLSYKIQNRYSPDRYFGIGF